MFAESDKEILSQLRPTDVVLDIGGWACPFNWANYILDAEPDANRSALAVGRELPRLGIQQNRRANPPSLAH